MRGMKLVAADQSKRKLVASAVCMPYSLVKYSIILGISPRLASLSHASFAATHNDNNNNIHLYTLLIKSLQNLLLPMMNGKVLKPPLALELCLLRRGCSITFSISNQRLFICREETQQQDVRGMWGGE